MPPLPALSPPRGLRADELEALVTQATLIFRPPGTPAGAMRANYPLLFDEARAGDLRVIPAGAGPEPFAAHAGVWLGDAMLEGRHARIACIGAVFTAPAFRGRGLADAILHDAITHARSRGADIGLISGARSLYERHGFVRLPPLVRARVPARASGLRLLEATAHDTPVLQQVAARETTRFERSADDWRALLTARTLLWEPGRVHLVFDGETPVAFLAVQDRARPQDEGPVARAIEVAGDRHAVLDAAAALASARREPALDVLASAGDTAFADAVRSRGLSLGTLDFGWSAAVWNPAFLSAPLPPYGLNYV